MTPGYFVTVMILPNRMVSSRAAWRGLPGR